MQSKSKWNKPRRNLEIGDMVLLQTDTEIWNNSPMAKNVSYETDKNGLVGAVRLRLSNGIFQILRRLVDKTVLQLQFY